jgi:hypothetical protein
MKTPNKKLILFLFLRDLIERSKKYGMGEDYIKGQFDEASHQLMLFTNKNGEHYEL